MLINGYWCRKGIFMKIAIFYLSDTIDNATKYNFDHLKNLISASDKGQNEINVFWAINKPIKEAIDVDLTDASMIRVSEEDFYNFGLYDSQHDKPLWKNNDFFLYYLSSRVVADFYFVMEGDYFINDVSYFETIFKSVGKVDYVLHNYWETPADSNYYWKNYTSNEILKYEAPYYLTNKNIMGATSELIKYLTDVRRNQALLTNQGVNIPNDNYFFGMELVKNDDLTGLFMGRIVSSMPLSWNDSKYYLDQEVVQFVGTVHPVRDAEKAISSNIQKRAIGISDFYDNQSYLNKTLIPALQKDRNNFHLSIEDILFLLKGISLNKKWNFLRYLESKSLIPLINGINENANLFEQTISDLKDADSQIMFALNTRYIGAQYPKEINFTNRALFKKVILSSSFNGSEGNLATDGNFNPNKYRDGGFHTNWENEASAIIDLAEIDEIKFINLYHRNGYFDRTKNLTIFTSVDGNDWESVENEALTNIQWDRLKIPSVRNSSKFEFRLSIPLGGRVSQFVKIVNTTPGNNPLHLNQIEIF